jgi:DNA-directed RNA polymerase subunit RPC12/RpoP
MAAMPIKFRCAYCNQLMGIARRKAGTVVTCPACKGQIIVPPNVSAEPAAAPRSPPDPVQMPKMNVFEGQDFDAALFHKSPMAAASGAEVARAPLENVDITGQEQSQSSMWLPLAIVGLVVALFAFSVGFLVARAL